jgi:hypothetical protein
MEYDKVRYMRILIAIFLLALFVSPHYALANEDEDELRALNYIPVDYLSFSRLMWKYRIYDFMDEDMVNEYLKIQNCDLYKQYSNNDFLWQGILNASQRELDYFASTFPDRFEVYAYIPIERYDFERSAFPIADDYRLHNAGAITIGVENITGFNNCVDVEIFGLFPNNIKFLPENKFSLTHIPAPPNEAEEILSRISQHRYRNTDDNFRVLPIRFRIKINDVDDFSDKRISSRIIYKGELDEIAVFEDPARENLIWKKQFKILD